MSHLPQYKIGAERFKDWHLVIFHITRKGEILLPASPMMVSREQDGGVENSGKLCGYYLRDLSFSFVVNKDEHPKVGIFLYDPSRVKKADMIDQIKKGRSGDGRSADGYLPPPLPWMDGFYFVGYYLLNSLRRDQALESTDRTHIITTLHNTERNHLIKIDFHYYLLPRESHQRFYDEYFGQGDQIDDIDLYYLSNPSIHLNLRDLIH